MHQPIQGILIGGNFIFKHAISHTFLDQKDATYVIVGLRTASSFSSDQTTRYEPVVWKTPYKDLAELLREIERPKFLNPQVTDLSSLDITF